MAVDVGMEFEYPYLLGAVVTLMSMLPDLFMTKDVSRLVSSAMGNASMGPDLIFLLSLPVI